VSWQTPAKAPLGVDGIVKNPSLVVDGTASYVAFQVDDTTDGASIPRDIYFARRTGETWNAPVQVSDGGAPSSRPVLEQGEDGTLHLVWGERLRDVSPRPGGDPHAAFYASSPDGGRTWSAPDTLFDSRTDRFFGVPRSIAIDEDGHPHVVLSSKERENRPATIKHFERVDGRWSGGRTSIGGFAGGSYPDIAARDDGTLLVTYVTADTTDPQGDKNTIFLATSSDGGDTWDDGTTIGNENFSSARWPCIEVEGQRVQAAWLDNEDARRGAELLFVNRSTDGGETWGDQQQIAELQSSASAAGFNPPELFLTGDRVHLAFSDDVIGRRESPTYYLNRTESGWSERTDPFPVEITTELPGLAAGPDGQIHLALGGKDTSGDLDREDGLFYTTGTFDGDG
jgi:hypothetical protein